MARKYEDLTGKQFGRWTVLEESEPKRDTSGHLRRWWLCECSCEKHTRRIVSGASLRKGHSESCGCLQMEHAIAAMSKAKKKTNTFEICGDICKVFDDSGNSFIIDIDDLESIKQHYWYKVIIGKGTSNEVSYAYTHIWNSEKRKDYKLSMHEYLTGEKYTDHINHNGLDNRRCNLRTISTDVDAPLTTNQGYNNYNHKLRSDNKSGHTGVFWNKGINKWSAFIVFNNKTKNLGTFYNKEEAIKAREEAEEKYMSGFNYKEKETTL